MKYQFTKNIISIFLAAVLLCGLFGCNGTVDEEDIGPESMDSEVASEVGAEEESIPEHTAVPVEIALKATPEPETKRDASRVIYDLAVAYANDDPPARIEALSNELCSIDKSLYEKWKEVFEYTDTCLGKMRINRDVLPDGLNNTDSLVIIVLGYQLNKDGTMAEELRGRLRVALKSAQKYPNAKILCTGGGTSPDKPELTEADSMAAWLKKKGISEDRIIIENKSKSTVDNAKYTFRILSKNYPEIKEAAIITSDYHVARGSVYMAAKFILSGGSNPVRVVSNAAYKTDKSDGLTKWRLVRGILNVLDDPKIDSIIEAEGFRQPKAAEDAA